MNVPLNRIKSDSDCVYIAGDICPVPSNIELFTNGSIEKLFDKSLLDRFLKSGVIANLETPLTDSDDPIRKSGPALRSSSEAVKTLKELNLYALGLANNHIMDQGISGFESTISALRSFSIPFFGAGANIEQAKRGLILDINGKKIALYACAEHEFSIASDNQAGANPFSASSLSDVEKLSDQSDYVIVLYHGMPEYYRYPSPSVQDRCRSLIDAGAHFVTCQHSHCIGCQEKYNNGVILYGQGDFCFACGDSSELRRTGLMVEFNLLSGGISYIPIENDGISVRETCGERSINILNEFEDRSKQIQNRNFLCDKWKNYCNSLSERYALQVARAIKPKWVGYFLRLLAKMGIYKATFRDDAEITHLLNILRCESHYEALRTILEERL